MKLNKNLAKTFIVCKNYNENAFKFIENMLSFAPSIEKALSYATNSCLSYAENGNLYGILGSWSIIAHLDNEGALTELKVDFSESKSSKSESYDTYSFHLRAFDENTSHPQNLVSAEKSRVHNYRFSLPKSIKLTTSQIVALSKPEIISRLNLDYNGNHVLTKSVTSSSSGTVETITHSYPYSPEFNNYTETEVSRNIPENIDSSVLV